MSNGSVEPEDYVSNWYFENQDAYILNLNRRRCESGELDGNQLTDKTLTDRWFHTGTLRCLLREDDLTDKTTGTNLIGNSVDMVLCAAKLLRTKRDGSAINVNTLRRLIDAFDSRLTT